MFQACDPFKLIYCIFFSTMFYLSDITSDKIRDEILYLISYLIGDEI